MFFDYAEQVALPAIEALCGAFASLGSQLDVLGEACIDCLQEPLRVCHHSLLSATVPVSLQRGFLQRFWVSRDDVAVKLQELAHAVLLAVAVVRVQHDVVKCGTFLNDFDVVL